MPINLRQTKPMKRDLVYTTDDWRLRPFDPTRVFASSPHQNRQFAPPVEKVGLDNTFGPQLIFAKAAPKGGRLPPSEGMQFFGHVAVDGQTEVMTVTLKDVDDHALWSKKLEPKVD